MAATEILPAFSYACGMISAKLSHGERVLLENVFFSLSSGERLAVIGETGSGKTMLALSILGLLPSNVRMQGGCLQLDGAALPAGRQLQALRGDKLVYIPQNGAEFLLPARTVRKQLYDSLKKLGLPRKDFPALAAEKLRLAGFDAPETVLDKYPFQLSGGMQQRVGIAMAMSYEPKLLLADEPTSALDVTIQAQILDLLREIQKKLGTATVFVTHDLGVVARIADRVAVMYAGKIVEIGTVDEIFYDPRHPYTWGLLRSIPAFSRGKESLPSIPGMPPSLLHPPKGDAFASRNAYALEIDFEEEPPMFRVTDSHYAATWLLDERAPKVVPPIGGNTDGT